MKTITFSSIKGGTGKTSHVIMLANYFGQAGFKVCVIAMDLNNAVDFYYLTEYTQSSAAERNIAAALSRPDNNLCDYTIVTEHCNVDIIPSSLYLADLRSISDKRLVQMIPTLEKDYDIVLIDTQPTYDNLVLSAYNASDIIITPANLCSFDFNTAAFLKDKISVETNKLSNWFVTINGFNARFEKSKKGTQKEYLEYFQNNFPMTPKETWLPWTSSVRKVTDQGMYISEYKLEGSRLSRAGIILPDEYSNKNTKSDNIVAPKLYNSIASLADWIIDENLKRPEEF